MDTTTVPGDMNPYEAPKSDSPSARPMLRGVPSDRVLAERLLVARDRGGYPLGPWLRWNAGRYVFLAAFLAAYMVLTAYTRSWTLFALALGFGLGSLLRDVGWLRASRRTRPFNDRVTDWEKVERIAAGEDETL